MARGKFRITDLPLEESQRHTVRRVLREIEEMGWVHRDSPRSSIWRLGPKAEMMLDVDSETVEESQS